MTESLEKESGGFFSRLKAGLRKTRDSLAGSLDNVVHGRARVGPELLEEIEEALLVSDVGVSTSQRILGMLEKEVASDHLREADQVMARLRELLTAILEQHDSPLNFESASPYVILMVGINGSGKTTTIGKLASRWSGDGRKVMLAAGDTFRAAAVEQLQMWADRSNVPCVRQAHGADPSAVAFDAVQAAQARGIDRVLVDTAGRLQTNVNLMEELKKVKRVIGKVMPDAPHAIWLVLDAGIGQNSLSQAKLFHEALGLDGLVMTKLDGTAKGGILFNIAETLQLPVRYIGIGEKAEDLQEFDPKAFVQALFT